jgi:glycerophosphoryl diester phosphodiesterase
MKKILRNKIYINAIKLIFHNIISLLIGQGSLLLLFFAVVTPLISYIYHFTLNITGFRYVTAHNIGSFLLNPVSILMIFLLFYIIGLFLLIEIYYLIIFFGQLEEHKKVRVYWIILQALYKVLLSLPKGNIRLIPAAWSTLCIFNLPLFSFVLYKNRMIRFVADEVPDNIFRFIIFVIIIGLICLLLFKRAFIYHNFILENKTYTEASKLGKDRVANKPLRALLYFIGWNIFIMLVVAVLYLFIMAVTMIFVSGTFDKQKAITMFIFLNENMQVYLITFIFLICTIGNLALYTHLFYFFQLKTDVNVELPENLSFYKNNIKTRSFKKVLITTLLILVAINLYYFAKILRNGSPLEYMNLDNLKVTSHRGFSHDIPENTIPAIDKAIEEGADYVEVDVRVTKDGVPVLLHDSSLKRTTGLKKNIYDTTYEVVAELDAGTWMDKSFAGTRIPTLQEALENCKGRVMLNLDLKYRNEEEGLTEKVVALIEEYEMVWQCVITSTSLKCLEEVKELNPDIRTGYITYQLYSGLIENEAVDFFSMKSNLITKNVLGTIHDNGKELIVWTVNSKTEIERLRRIGVDNIITDNPAYAKQVLYQSESDWYFVTLLKIMME